MREAECGIASKSKKKQVCCKKPIQYKFLFLCLYSKGFVDESKLLYTLYKIKAVNNALTKVFSHKKLLSAKMLRVLCIQLIFFLFSNFLINYISKYFLVHYDFVVLQNDYYSNLW